MEDSDSPSGSESPGTSVTVEREADATSERAVKKSDATGASVEADPETAADEEDGRTAEDESETTSESGSGDDESEAADDGVPVEDIKGIGPAYRERLADAGVHTVADLAAADAAELGAATGIEEGRIEGWIERAAEN